MLRNSSGPVVRMVVPEQPPQQSRPSLTGCLQYETLVVLVRAALAVKDVHNIEVMMLPGCLQWAAALAVSQIIRVDLVEGAAPEYRPISTCRTSGVRCMCCL